MHRKRRKLIRAPSLRFTNFACAWAGSGYTIETFTVTSNVNFTNGVNLDKAIKVATKVFSVAMGQDKPHEVVSASKDSHAKILSGMNAYEILMAESI